MADLHLKNKESKKKEKKLNNQIQVHVHKSCDQPTWYFENDVIRNTLIIFYTYKLKDDINNMLKLSYI